MIDAIDRFLLRFQRWIRSEPLLYRFTLGTRILLAIGFIPTGIVKVLGLPFTILGTETLTGAFFDTLYQSGLYWQFLGLAQVLAGIFMLFRATSAIGAVMFFGIILNIFLITVSYDFNFTSVVTGPMLLAATWLLFWDYDRLRGLLTRKPITEPIPSELSLSGTPERIVYLAGLTFGMILFGLLRGLPMPTGFEFILVPICLACLLIAAGFGVVHRKLSHSPDIDEKSIFRIESHE